MPKNLKQILQLLIGGVRSAYKDYIRVYRVQAAQLRHNERKEASSRENGDKEVL